MLKRPQDLVKIFNDHELELLISGLPEIDIEDLKANTDYAGYSAASKAIQWFWQVVRELNKQDLALLVQFVTGTSKVPLEGFSALQVHPFFLMLWRIGFLMNEGNVVSCVGPSCVPKHKNIKE
jgi:hypothetical protein